MRAAVVFALADPAPGTRRTADDAAAAEALLESARAGETGNAEEATGYYWGERRLRPHVERILLRARADHDDRLIQLAERFLK